jgi:hypothetical protein
MAASIIQGVAAIVVEREREVLVVAREEREVAVVKE